MMLEVTRQELEIMLDSLRDTIDEVPNDMQVWNLYTRLLNEYAEVKECNLS